MIDGGPWPLNSEAQVEDTLVQLPAGVHSLRADFNGDNSFNASFGLNTLTITKATTATAATSSSYTPAAGASVTLTANITTQSRAIANASQEPTGNVQFKVNGTNFGSPVAVTGGSSGGFAKATATLITSTLPTGANSIVAQYVGDSNYSTSSSTAITVTVQGVDLSIALSHTGSFNQGLVGGQYTITTSNAGNSASSGAVTVVDTLPSGLTATAIAGTGWGCTLGTLTCTRSDSLAGGAAFPVITLTVNVSAGAPASVTNSVTVSGGGDNNAANNTANDPTAVTAVAGGPYLSLQMSHTGNFTAGTNGTYTLVVYNNGTATNTGQITVTDTLPSGLTFVSGGGTFV
ncbi:MAG: Ig-like domain repeat protein, partial [Bryobacteraceae bacterium]